MAWAFFRNEEHWSVSNNTESNWLSNVSLHHQFTLKIFNEYCIIFAKQESGIITAFALTTWVTIGCGIVKLHVNV